MAFPLFYVALLTKWSYSASLFHKASRYGGIQGCDSETHKCSPFLSRSYRFLCHYNNIAYFSHQFPGELKRSGERGPEITPKSLLLKPGQSGLRPPGFSTLPAARLAAFGFVRSSSVSSVSSNQSNDSSHSDPSRLSQRELCSHHTFYITVIPFYDLTLNVSA